MGEKGNIPSAGPVSSASKNLMSSSAAKMPADPPGAGNWAKDPGGYHGHPTDKLRPDAAAKWASPPTGPPAPPPPPPHAAPWTGPPPVPPVIGGMVRRRDDRDDHPPGGPPPAEPGH